MVITAVERKPRRRSRVDVYIDGVLRCDLARDLAADRDVRPGRAIEQAEVDALVAADQRQQALATAAAMLARRPRSERELRRRLGRARTEPALVDETIERLRGARLIDDAAFAATLTEHRDRFSPRGRRLLASELRAHGIESEATAAAVEGIDEADAAYRLASRRAPSLRDADYAAFRAKLGGHLQRRGFGWDIVRATVERCWRETRGESPQDDPEGSIE